MAPPGGCVRGYSGGPAGRGHAVGRDWIRGLSKDQNKQTFDTFRHWSERQGFVVVSDAWDKAKFVTLENPPAASDLRSKKARRRVVHWRVITAYGRATHRSQRLRNSTPFGMGVRGRSAPAGVLGAWPPENTTRRPGPLLPRTKLHQSRVGLTGFEPATLRSQSGCATKLRYSPPATRSGGAASPA
jgi:hypothetical protein